jgi:hypothetical protein
LYIYILTNWWLLLNRREDIDPEIDPSPHPLVVQPRTILTPLLMALVLFLLEVLSSTVGGVLEPRSI